MSGSHICLGCNLISSTPEKLAGSQVRYWSYHSCNINNSQNIAFSLSFKIFCVQSNKVKMLCLYHHYDVYGNISTRSLLNGSEIICIFALEISQKIAASSIVQLLWILRSYNRTKSRVQKWPVERGVALS